MKVIAWLQAAQLCVLSVGVVILLVVVVPLLRESSQEKHNRYLREKEKIKRELEKDEPTRDDVKKGFTG
jgi:Na+(H+)/acetate symporter ActP